MAFEHILVEKTGGVAIITLNRPESLNAMNHRLSSELHEAVLEACADAAIGCLVVTGAGHRAFSAGGDIHEQRENDRATRRRSWTRATSCAGGAATRSARAPSPSSA